MTDKTKSELMAELQQICDSINGEDFKGNLNAIVTECGSTDGLYISIATKYAVHCGSAHPYTPDPDTKDEAIEKVKTEYFKKCKDKTSTWCSISMFEKENKFMMTWGNVDDEDGKMCFPFVYTATATDQITDEAPPKGTPVVGGDSHRHFLSLGNIGERGLLVIGDSGITVRLITYKSLTTPHRSKDWED